jgi:hypothetical protein
MYSGRRSVSRRFLLFTSLAALVAVGCWGTQTADQATESALKAQGLTKGRVFPLAGKVMVDGENPQSQSQSKSQSPSKRNPIVVVLNDVSKPDVSPLNRPRAELNAQGEFAFQTYTTADGVAPGKYVVTIARFKYNKKMGLLGPDQLNNLYNDPDKNANIKDFVIDHQSPGKTDYLFNLQLAGKDAAAPGPHALTNLGFK